MYICTCNEETAVNIYILSLFWISNSSFEIHWVFVLPADLVSVFVFYSRVQAAAAGQGSISPLKSSKVPPSSSVSASAKRIGRSSSSSTNLKRWAWPPSNQLSSNLLHFPFLSSFCLFSHSSTSYSLLTFYFQLFCVTYSFFLSFSPPLFHVLPVPWWPSFLSVITLCSETESRKRKEPSWLLRAVGFKRLIPCCLCNQISRVISPTYYSITLSKPAPIGSLPCIFGPSAYPLLSSTVQTMLKSTF